MKHGEVRSLAADQGKFVVISADDYNEIAGAEAIVVPLIRRRGFNSEFLVETHEMDPASGSIALSFPEMLPHDTATDLHGMLTGTTVSKIKDGLRLIYDL